MSERRKVAIVVGGGPAPGINAVIAAATIRCALEGVDVVGIQDGFKWIMQGDIDHVVPLTIGAVSRIHSRGGSIIGIARANPTTEERFLENTVLSLLRLDVERELPCQVEDLRREGPPAHVVVEVVDVWQAIERDPVRELLLC